jgi:hypothetical protein
MDPSKPAGAKRKVEVAVVTETEVTASAIDSPRAARPREKLLQTSSLINAGAPIRRPSKRSTVAPARGGPRAEPGYVVGALVRNHPYAIRPSAAGGSSPLSLHQTQGGSHTQLGLCRFGAADPLFTNKAAFEFSSRFSLSIYSKDVH